MTAARQVSSGAQGVGIAVVGVACTLPGAGDGEEFWSNIFRGAAFGTSLPGNLSVSPGSLGVAPSILRGSDPGYLVLLRTLDRALADAGYELRDPGLRVSVIVGSSTATTNRQVLPDPISGFYLINAGGVSSFLALDAGIRELHEGAADVVLTGGWEVPTESRIPEIRAGAVILALTRLEDVEPGTHRIYAVIRGVASGSDQQEVFRYAYRLSAVVQSTVELIESSGEDDLEAHERFFGGSQSRPTCAFGSLGLPQGNTCAIPGAAGLLKIVMALCHRILPPTAGKPDADPDLAKRNLYHNTETRPWIRRPGLGPRRAGVSGCGWNGTRAHVVMEEYRNLPGAQRPSAIREWSSELVLLDSESRLGLAQATARLQEYLSGARAAPVRDIAYTCWTALKGAPHRLALVASSLADLENKLKHARALLQEPHDAAIRERDGIYYRRPGARGLGKLALLFPGEGSQYANMFRDLSLYFASVRECFDQTDYFPESAAESESAWPLSAALFPAPSSSANAQAVADARLSGMDGAMGALIASEHAMLDLLRRFSLMPSMVLGYSCGEWMAMAAAGIVDKEELLCNIRALSGLDRELAEQAAARPMQLVWVGARRETVEALLGPVLGRAAHIAADNCPGQILLSLEPDAEREVIARLTAKSVPTERLQRSSGYHTPTFEPFCARIREFAESLRVHTPVLAAYSCATGGPYPSGTAAIQALVGRMFVNPVLFRQAIECMYADGARIFLETGPRSLLTAFVDDILRERPHLALSLDQYRQPGLAQLQHVLAKLLAEGVSLDLAPLFVDRRPRRLAFECARDTPVASCGYDEIPIHLAEPRQNTPTAAASTEPADFEAHFARMKEFLRVQERAVIDALKASAAPARCPRNQAPGFGPLLGNPEILHLDPGVAGGMKLLLDSREHLYLHDHCLYFPGSEWNRQPRPLLSMPMTGSIEMMAEAATWLCPGQRVVAVREVLARRWINIEQDGAPITLVLNVEKLSSESVRSKIFLLQDATEELAGECVCVLQPDFPEPPDPVFPVLRGRSVPLQTAAQLYSERLLFHGPRFQDVSALDAIGAQAICGRLRVLPRYNLLRSEPEPRFCIDPVLLDAASQIAGYWALAQLAEGQAVFPVRVEELALYADVPDCEEEIGCSVRIKQVSSQRMRADFHLTDRLGKLIAYVRGWEAQRFYLPRQVARFWRFPNCEFQGEKVETPVIEQAGIECSFLEAWSDGGLRDMLMRSILSQRELAESLSHEGSAQRAWFLERAAAKDAARRWIWRHSRRNLFPVDINILRDAENQVADGPWSSESGIRPYVDAACCRGSAIGVAAAGPVAVAMLPEQMGQEACMRAAVGKLERRDRGVEVTMVLHGKLFAAVAFFAVEIERLSIPASKESGSQFFEWENRREKKPPHDSCARENQRAGIDGFLSTNLRGKLCI